jgi:hypothetical protein
LYQLVEEGSKPLEDKDLLCLQDEQWDDVPWRMIETGV